MERARVGEVDMEGSTGGGIERSRSGWGGEDDAVAYEEGDVGVGVLGEVGVVEGLDSGLARVSWEP